ncbi:ATP-binding cassette domain-containing protein [Janibacter melonis]|uniref:ABC transporter ATP-binding protein n=1 Tax=Janibacter melonis TaxID=262209 RepID=UPI0020432C44|nr:ATP-binding cassette domain-containing protein [Janibacter melonis]MCM3556080.1 ATP-binding cassette domain-containing protein [Janibacter melonis]
MIQIEHLTKRYGSFTAVDDVSFTVEPGRVVGFLGPNGAGKSTAMRMLVGLTPATSGRALVHGRPYRLLEQPGRHVGVMLDASAQHPGRTGREVIRLAAIQMGARRGRVDEVLDLVGLTPKESSRRVRNYSLGMRQRLGLAAALVGEPEVLVLDEPANGLDPQGIHWMRTLLRDFADDGGTVLLSSHLLHEVQVIADELVIIGHGRVVAQGSVEELLSGRGSRVRSADDERLAAALREQGLEVTAAAGGLQVAGESEVVGRVALAAGVPLVSLAAASEGALEEIFLELTSAQARSGHDQAAQDRAEVAA